MDEQKPETEPVVETGSVAEVPPHPIPRLKLRKTNPAIEEAGMVTVPSTPPATELTFLLDLLLNEKLSKSVKEKITDRIRLVELQMQRPVVMPAPQAVPAFPQPFPQPYVGPSAASPGIHAHLPPPPQMGSAPGVPAGNSVINQALHSRNNAIARGSNPLDKPDPGRTGPRKF